jgi:hypothetical protein
MKMRDYFIAPIFLIVCYFIDKKGNFYILVKKNLYMMHTAYEFDNKWT